MVDAEVRLVWKHSLAVGTILGLVSCPVAAETGQTITVSTWYGRWVGEDVSTQRAKEVLLIQQAYRRGHSLKTKDSFYFFILHLSIAMELMESFKMSNKPRCVHTVHEMATLFILLVYILNIDSRH